MIEYALVVLSTMFTSAAILLLKKASLATDLGRGWRELFKSALNGYFAGTCLCVGAAIGLYLLALSSLDLSLSYSFTALQYVFVLAGSGLFMGEKVNRFHAAGVLCIFLGLLSFNLL